MAVFREAPTTDALEQLMRLAESGKQPTAEDLKRISAGGVNISINTPEEIAAAKARIDKVTSQGTLLEAPTPWLTYAVVAAGAFFLARKMK